MLHIKTYTIRNVLTKELEVIHSDMDFTVGESIYHKNPYTNKMELYNVLQAKDDYSPDYSYEKMRGMSM